MLKSVLLVGAGSFVGGALRYMISLLMKGTCGASFPWATLAVNLAGCLLIGVVYALFSRYASTSHALCLLLTTGFCGGFTTFSAFANEGVVMLQSGNTGVFFIYVLTSVVAGIALAALGYWTVRMF
jgi:CrcB protein